MAISRAEDRDSFNVTFLTKRICTDELWLAATGMNLNAGDADWVVAEGRPVASLEQKW